MIATAGVRAPDPMQCSLYQRDLRRRLRPPGSTTVARIMSPMPTTHQPPANATSPPITNRSTAPISRYSIDPGLPSNAPDRPRRLHCYFREPVRTQLRPHLGGAPGRRRLPVGLKPTAGPVGPLGRLPEIEFGVHGGERGPQAQRQPAGLFLGGQALPHLWSSLSTAWAAASACIRPVGPLRRGPAVK